jgi:gamma-glutamyltranspeptidase/glutathione hydrolase
LQVSIALHQPRFLRFPSSKKLFLHEDGSPAQLGEVRKNPDLARTFRLLAKEEKFPKVFYEGEIARDIVAAIREAPFQPGNAQGIRIRSDGKLEGGADPRREGAVRGY